MAENSFRGEFTKKESKKKQCLTYVNVFTGLFLYF